MLNDTLISETLQNLFGDIAQWLAYVSGFRRRVSKLGGSEVAQALIGGWLIGPT